MKIIWQDRKQRGKIDEHVITDKPQFSFQYEYLSVDDEMAEYTPKDAANYPDLTITREDMELYYVNRSLTGAQKQEVMEFYASFPRPPEVLPNFDRQTQKLVEIGVEVIEGLTYKKYEVQAKTQTELNEYLESITKPRKINEIKDAFRVAAVSSVTDANGISWHGGQSSALAIDGAVRIAEQANRAEFTIYDVDDNGHMLTVAQAKEVVMTIGVKYEQDFAKQKMLIKQVNNALTVDEVETITW